MPLYEYECQACHRRTEKIKSFSAPPETVCPHCGGHLEQTLSAPAVQFKGAGWYVNDYAKRGSSAKKGADAGKEGGSADVSAAAESAGPSDSTAAKKPADSPAAASAGAPAAKSENAAASSGSSAKSE